VGKEGVMYEVELEGGVAKLTMEISILKVGNETP
jgi:hypothetical protein